MKIESNVILAPYTTFKIGGAAKYFVEAVGVDELREAVEFGKDHNLPLFVLGGGSNLLISDEGFNGLVIHFKNKGIEVLQKDDQTVQLQLASGEVWDETVKFAVSNNWWGIENLSHIPGSCGAFAVQNVGAYGQEASQVIDYVIALNLQTRLLERIANQNCHFAYRSSIFNSSQKGKHVILQTVITLHKNGQPNLSYIDLKNRFTNHTPSIQEIREAIIEIRNKKFPFPVDAKNGSAGSFFKNFNLTAQKFEQLKQIIGKSFGINTVKILEQKSHFNETQQTYKVPAAFLMDIAGLKQMQVGGALINPTQPLVIVNTIGTATAQDVLALAQKVRDAIFEKFGLQISIEPELVGFEKQPVASLS